MIRFWCNREQSVNKTELNSSKSEKYEAKAVVMAKVVVTNGVAYVAANNVSEASCSFRK